MGLLYTRDVKKYLLRLGLFALVSQPFYILAFHPISEFAANFTNWNIFFTLFLSLLGMYGLKERSGGSSPWPSSPSAGGTSTTPAPASSSC